MDSELISQEAVEAAAKVSYEHQNGEGAWERCGDAWKRAYIENATAVLSHPATQYLIREARAAELETVAEHEASRSQAFMNAMEHMMDSREYDRDDILPYGAYSAKAQTSAYWLRARADAIRNGRA